MKAHDRQLQRLLEAAACVTSPPTGDVPFALEARLLAAWRSRPTPDEGVALLHLVRQGLAWACALMLVSTALSYFQWQRQGVDEWTYARSFARITLIP
jgi:hypothetical protein